MLSRLDSDLDDQLFEKRFSLTRRAVERLGPRYPRHTLVLEIAPPRLAPMSDQQFNRAVEVLAEMTMDRQHEGDSTNSTQTRRATAA